LGALGDVGERAQRVTGNVQRLHPDTGNVELLLVFEQISLPRNATLIRAVPENPSMRKALQHALVPPHVIDVMMSRQNRHRIQAQLLQRLQDRRFFTGIDDNGVFAARLMQQVAVVVAQTRNEMYFHARTIPPPRRPRASALARQHSRRKTHVNGRNP
jgi:hypothetical protein